MIFPRLELENIVQVDDKTRLDASKTFVSKGEAAVTLVEIEPEASAGFVDVYNADSDNWYLDWAYSGASRTVTVSVRVTTDGSPTTITKDIEVITESDDALFSKDSDIIQHDKDIMRHVRNGRDTYLDKHREAQTIIFNKLDEKGFKDKDGNRLDKTNILEPKEFLDWSKFLALSIIYGEISNAKDDVFLEKSKHFEKMANEAKTRSFLRLDIDEDGEQDDNEFVSFTQGSVVRG